MYWGNANRFEVDLNHVACADDRIGSEPNQLIATQTGSDFGFSVPHWDFVPVAQRRSNQNEHWKFWCAQAQCVIGIEIARMDTVTVLTR
jgi:hypothetical protein